MTWTIKLEKTAVTELNKLDKTIRKRIESFLIKLAQQDNPRFQGKALTGRYSGLWRYRIGDA